MESHDSTVLDNGKYFPDFSVSAIELSVHLYAYEVCSSCENVHCFYLAVKTSIKSILFLFFYKKSTSDTKVVTFFPRKQICMFQLIGILLTIHNITEFNYMHVWYLMFST